jgi:NAD(P)-dependent dehydrogenase (short-subunit alcohol dehydrogenase family)
MITGGGRGFGLALVTELLARPTSEVSKIIVSARKTSSELEALSKESSSRITVVSFDVTDEASIKKAVSTVEAALGEQGLDVLVNNAGVSEHADGVTSM